MLKQMGYKWDLQAFWYDMIFNIQWDYSGIIDGMIVDLTNLTMKSKALAVE